MTVQLREEQAVDEDAIRRLTELAFRGRPYAAGDEQDVVDRLRTAGALTVSLVAEDAGEVIGQITFSPAGQADGSGPWFALGPVSVAPARQGQGVGAQLIREGLARVRALDGLGCILTGNPVYYRHFGFEVTPACCPEGEPGQFFQLLCFGDIQPQGLFSFHGAFYGDP